jgi:uncharacterized membrane-anchored protein YjiN (DUF445 family)
MTTTKERDLDAMKARATGLLAFAAICWVALHFAVPGFWTSLGRATAEAALVGGLADWFAITALFRHPLGLPIPHTAIIARNQARIGEGLGRFIRDHFLDPDELARRVRRRGAAAMLATWLGQRPNRASVAARLTATLPVLLQALDDRGVRRLFAEAIRDGLGRVDLAPIATNLLHQVADKRPFSPAIDRLVPALGGWLGDRRDSIAQIVGRQTGKWIPETIDARIAGLVVDGLRGWLDELRDPANPDRRMLEDWIAFELRVWAADDRIRTKLADARDMLAFSPAMEELAGSAWADLRARLEADAAAAEPRLAIEIDRALAHFADILAADKELQSRLDGLIERFLRDAIAPLRAGIAAHIERTVAEWDPETLTRRIEVETGRDLQFVRINGTLVGALIGALLFLASRALQG